MIRVSCKQLKSKSKHTKRITRMTNTHANNAHIRTQLYCHRSFTCPKLLPQNGTNSTCYMITKVLTSRPLGNRTRSIHWKYHPQKSWQHFSKRFLRTIRFHKYRVHHSASDDNMQPKVSNHNTPRQSTVSHASLV